MIHLDEAVARERKAERAWRFNVVQVPALRMMGFVLVLIIVVTNTEVGVRIEGMSLTVLAVSILAYAAASWLLLYRFYERLRPRIDLGLAFLIADVLVYTGIIFVTGGENSWLYVLLLARVADQANTNFRRVAGFAHLNALCYTVMLLLIEPVYHRPVDWRAGITRLVTLYLVSIYISLTARTAEALREQTTAAIHMARTLLADLERMAMQKDTILESAPDGIIAVDLEGRASSVNPAAARMLGSEQAALFNRDVHEAVRWTTSDGSRLRREDGPVLRVLRTGVPQGSIEAVFWRVTRDSGTPNQAFPVETAIAPMRSDGKVTGAVITFIDISQRNEVARMKGEFVSTVSHELRTPLTSIRGSLGMLAAGMLGDVTDKGHRMLEIAINNTDRLVRLINDILDIERMESGQVQLQRTSCRADDLIGQAVDAVRGSADHNHVRLEVEALPLELNADSDRIIQTLTNLIGNAVKFSESSTTVTISASRSGPDVLFSVRDRGRGIPADKLEMVFERFLQVDASDAREKGGTGLGLAICRSIVSQHGGRIWAELPADGGTRFCFTIPPFAAETSESAPSLRLRPRGEHLQVLIAEDDADLCLVLSAMFERQGLTPHVAHSGTEAIRLSQSLRPDLLLLDLGLPGHDGFQVVEWLRHFQGLEDLTLIVYTARDLTPQEQQTLQLGRTVFFTKSRITPEELERAFLAMLAS